MTDRSSVRPGRFAAAVAGSSLGLWLLKLHEPASGTWLEPLDRLTAATTAALLRLWGLEVSLDGAVVSHAEGFGIYVYYLCTAWPPLLVMLAGLAVLPGTRRAKLTMALAGALALATLNQIRLTTLFWTGVHLPSIYGPLHDWLWQPVMLLAVGALWMIWLRTRAPAGVRADR